MTEFLKILLGSKDVVIRDNEDSFLNIELSRTANEIKPDSVDNDFNLTDQYNKERNDSLKFCIYGTLESKYVDCTNITISVRTSDNDVIITPKKSPYAVSSTSHLITSIPLSANGSLSKNVYGNEKASYFFLFELDRNSFDRKVENKKLNLNFQKTESVILTINDVAKKISDTIEIPFIFFDENGDLISYGTKTTDIDVDGASVEIDNDFPFFYDRHWIKTNISPSKIGYLSFVPAGGVTIVPENMTGGTFFGEIKLDFPSKAGIESATVVLDTDNTIRNPNMDFTFVPQFLKWDKGDISKKFSVGILNDLFVESAERISFKLDNVQNAIINSPQDGQFSIEIIDDDIPSAARFKDSSLIVSQSAKTLDIEILFDKPIEVPGQSIDVVVEDRGNYTTATLGANFDLGVPNKPGATNKTLFLKQGDTGATFSINIIETFGYDIDKTIGLRLGNATQNITVSTKQNPALNITITDSMINKFTRYIFPADFQFGHGAYRVNRKTLQEKYEWSLSNKDESFTNTFPFSIEIINNGETIIYNNVVFEQGDSVLVQPYSAGMTESFVIDLPSNDTPNTAGNFYENTKYIFKFIDIQSNVNVPLEGIAVSNNNRYNDVQVIPETKPAGNVGERKFYLVTEISNVKSRYNKSNNSCNTNINGELANVKINGMAFVPKTTLPATNQFGAPIDKTSCQYFFRSKPIQDHCGFTGLLLPFGFTIAANAPYAERFLELSFGEMFVQVGKTSTANSKLKVESKSNSSPDLSSFFRWNDSSANFKNDIEMHITNLGTKDVTIFGKDAGEGDTVIIRQSDINTDFSKMNLRLNGNSAYSFSANSFNEAAYSISFKNVNFYGTDGQPTGDSSEFSITPFKLPASAATQSIPVYTLISQFDEVDVKTNPAGQFSCGGTSFAISRAVDIRGLLFTNSKTSYISSKFVAKNQDIIADCLTDDFQFKII